MENEKARKRMSELHEAMTRKASVGLVEPALQDAKEKLKIMKMIKKEMILDIPAALMERVSFTPGLRNWSMRPWKKQLPSAVVILRH